MTDRLQEKLQDGRNRCQARKSYGSAWVAGREQCGKAAKDGDVFCGTHQNQMAKRLERKKNIRGS